MYMFDAPFFAFKMVNIIKQFSPTARIISKSASTTARG